MQDIDISKYFEFTNRFMNNKKGNVLIIGDDRY